MFKKTIDALKAAEVAIEDDLGALWVPYDPTTGGGGVHWHAAGSGILQTALAGVSNLRSDLEKRQTLAAEAAGEGTPTKAEQIAAAEAQVAAANAALEAAKALPEGGPAG